jgi:hypothetical protein
MINSFRHLKITQKATSYLILSPQTQRKHSTTLNKKTDTTNVESWLEYLLSEAMESQNKSINNSPKSILTDNTLKI